MPNLPITLELLQTALHNFEGRPITADLILEVAAEVDRLRTREDHAPAAPDGPASAQEVGAEAEAEAAAEAGPADETLDGEPPEVIDAAAPDNPVATKVSKPREKMQKIVVLYDPENRIDRKLEFLAYVVEIPEDEPPDGRTFKTRLQDAVNAHNESKRGSKHPAETFRDAIEKIPYDWMRYYKVRVLTETAVYVLLQGAELPAAPAPVQPPAPEAQ